MNILIFSDRLRLNSEKLYPSAQLVTIGISPRLVTFLSVEYPSSISGKIIVSDAVFSLIDQ